MAEPAGEQAVLVEIPLRAREQAQGERVVEPAIECTGKSARALRAGLLIQ
jgi:hypothetical protein